MGKEELFPNREFTVFDGGEEQDQFAGASMTAAA